MNLLGVEAEHGSRRWNHSDIGSVLGRPLGGLYLLWASGVVVSIDLRPIGISQARVGSLEDGRNIVELPKKRRDPDEYDQEPDD